MRSYNFEQKKGSVYYRTSIINRQFDATQVTTIDIERRDGAKFQLREAFGFWRVYLPNGDELHSMEGEDLLEPWLKKHNLPSMEWIESKINEIERSYQEDPMGHPNQYE